MRDVFNTVNSLDKLDKLRVWNHYNISQLSLKHRSNIVVKKKERKCLKGELKHVGENELGYKVFAYDNKYEWVGEDSVEFEKLWQDISIIPFEDWISKDNYKINDHGENWKEQYWADRYTIQRTGIYDWYVKFNEDINL